MEIGSDLKVLCFFSGLSFGLGFLKRFGIQELIT